ncbi:MAG: HD domain-containing protein, partial [Candidatus Paceibacterota bacterium]
MKYQDKVYGNFNITEPVILELLNSPALKRLRDVDQGGYEPLIAKTRNKGNKLSGHDRLAHSVGVYLLLKKYNAPIKEQIAGLIHDVSHSVFSHCIDYAVATGDGKKQNHQDNLFDSFIKKTPIPPILKKYGFDLKYILSDKNFPLKEKLLPDLCADRIDYILREGIIFKEITVIQAREMLDNLTIKNDRWIFKNLKTAKKFARLFYKMNRDYYAGFSAATMFRAVGDCLKYALTKGYIA